MHENILHLAGNKDHFSNGYSYLQDIYLKPAASQSSYTHARANTPVNVNQSQASIGVSPILPGTGSITHNVRRMLNDSDQPQKSQLTTSSSREERYSLYTTAHFLSFRHRMMNDKNGPTHGRDDNQEEIQESICSNMSISTDGSISPTVSSFSSSSNSFDSLPLSNTPPSAEKSPLSHKSSSAESSPSSGSSDSSSLTSSKNRNHDNPKKNVRTNYTNEQVQALLKIFHETPYPDSEMMENIGKDLGIPEKKVKIWFQNKRARWRRRVNENTNNHPQSFLPVSPVLPSVIPYGFMPTEHTMMTSSPIPRINGYYPWMQGSPSLNNNQKLQGQFSTSQIPSKFQGTYQNASMQNQAFPVMTMTSFAPTMSSAQYSGPLSQPGMATNQTRHSFQYPSQMYASTYTPAY